MEDAATAEISRTQVWQWLHQNITLENGREFNAETYKKLRAEEVQKIKELVGEENYKSGKFEKAIQIFDELVLSHKFTEFLTLEAYKYI